MFCFDKKVVPVMDDLIRTAMRPDIALSGVRMLENALQTSMSTISNDELEQVAKLVVTQSTT